MDENKQIDGMARLMCKYYADDPNCCRCPDCWVRDEAKVLYEAGYRKQSEGEQGTLTKAHIQAHYEAIYALADMVNQFGYSTTFRNQEAVCGGGLSALEEAFGALQDCGCELNSNGSITLKKLFAFQEEIDAKMKGE